MDLIAIDIGNSTISLGVFTHQKLSRTEHLPVNKSSHLSKKISALRAMCTPSAEGVKTTPVVCCSVNQAALEEVEQVVNDTMDQNVLLVGRNIPVDMKVAVESPETLGSDRLINAAAAFDVVEEAVVIADFGTATTVDCVNDMGIFIGGIIFPGLNMCAQALHQHTSQLPQVTIEVPVHAYGTNTIQAIQSGIFHGTLGMLREIIEQFATSLGRWPHVVITGGFSPLIAKKCDFIDSLVPHLCLNGLYLAYDKYLISQKEMQDS